MITIKDLHEAIAECEGQRNPNANTCLKLASYYTILNHMEQKDVQPVIVPKYSTSAKREYDSDTEFMASIKGKDYYEIWTLIDELVSTVQVLNPNLYRGFIKRINEL